MGKSQAFFRGCPLYVVRHARACFRTVFGVYRVDEKMPTVTAQSWSEAQLVANALNAMRCHQEVDIGEQVEFWHYSGFSLPNWATWEHIRTDERDGKFYGTYKRTA